MYKRVIIFLSTLTAVTYVSGQSFTEWQDQNVNEVNRLPMRTSFYPFSSAVAAETGNPKTESNYLDLNGKWKFNWVENADERPTDFFEVSYNDKGWKEISVPGIWELNGYGDPLYVNINFQCHCSGHTINPLTH